MGTVRLLPLVAFAALCLLTLKTAGLLFSGGYVLTGQAPVSAQEAEATADSSQQAADKDKNPSPQTADSKQEGVKVSANTKTGEKFGTTTVLPSADIAAGTSGNAILESLAKRRRQIEAESQKLKLRENLLKAAEKQIAKRIKELKEIEKRISGEHKKKEKDEEEQLARLVKMYSTMKPASAARIFNRLDITILKELVKSMKTRKMAPILAAMDPSRAELLTIEIAKQGQEKKPELPDLTDLPKIPSVGPRS